MTSSPLSLLLHRWDQRVALSDEAREAIAGLPYVRRSYDREAYLIREGEAPHSCGLLLSGYAFRQKLVSSGSRQIISIHIPGEFVDLQNMLLTTADHSVQSAGRSEVALVSRSALAELATVHADIARAIWIDTLVDSSIFREWVVNVGRRDALQRIAHLLCELMLRLERSGVCVTEPCDFPFTQEQIADATGLTSVHTNRKLQELRRSGVIALASSKLTVIDWERLRDFGDFGERYLHYGQ